MASYLRRALDAATGRSSEREVSDERERAHLERRRMLEWLGVGLDMSPVRRSTRRRGEGVPHKMETPPKPEPAENHKRIPPKPGRIIDTD